MYASWQVVDGVEVDSLSSPKTAPSWPACLPTCPVATCWPRGTGIPAEERQYWALPRRPEGAGRKGRSPSLRDEAAVSRWSRGRVDGGWAAGRAGRGW